MNDKSIAHGFNHGNKDPKNVKRNNVQPTTHLPYGQVSKSSTKGV
jgi:hypothetical protein